MQFQSAGASGDHGDSVEDEMPEAVQPQLSKKFRYLASFLFEKEQAASRSTTPTLNPEQDELRLYEANKLDISEEVDPMQFWIENEGTYPLLTSLAFDILSIPASSAPVE